MNASHQVATGRRQLLALGREDGWQLGGENLLAHDPVLPSGGRLRRTTLESPAVNRRGLKTRGTPGPVEGAYPFEGLLTAGLALDFAYGILGRVEKSEPVPGVFTYDFEDGGDEHADVSFHALGGLPPLYRQQVYGIRFSDWTTEVEPGQHATLKATGVATHGTQLGAAVPDPANLGSRLPRVRGLMVDPTRGDVHVRVTQDVAGGGLEFEVEVSGGAPAWAGAFTYQAVTDAAGDHRWQNLRDQDGQDLGPYDEGKAPLEIFLGRADELSDYAVGDVFTFPAPNTWPTPALPTAGGRVFRGAHYEARLRKPGEGEWKRVRRSSASLMTSTVLHENRGDPSDYIAQLYSVGEYAHTLKLVRDYVDPYFDTVYDLGDRMLEVEHGFVGQLLDAATETRESIWWTLPAMELVSLDSPASNAGAVAETLELEARPDPDGGAPIRLRVTTDVDWTP